MMEDIGVDIRYTLSARKNPGSNTDLFALADERTTTVTLGIQTNILTSLIIELFQQLMN